MYFYQSAFGAFLRFNHSPVLIGGSASFVYDSLVVMVIALSSAFSYTCFTIRRKESGTMAQTKNLCAQISEDLFQRIKTHLERESTRTGKKLTQRVGRVKHN